MEPDGFYLPEISTHSLEKIQRHNFYAALFSKAMSKKWRNRVYVGLYSGAGRAIVRRTNKIVETSAMAVLTQEVPFTKYIFVDANPDCITALLRRIEALSTNPDVTLINDEVNASVSTILRALPPLDVARQEGLIGLCFVDPFRMDLDFGVIRALSAYRLDFLVMLPLGFDLRRNLRRYLDQGPDDQVGAMIDDRNWRAEWTDRHQSSRYFIRFFVGKFDEAMVRLGFRRRDIEDTHSVTVTGMGVYLYSLALYTRHELGEQFWKTTLAKTNVQTSLDL